MQPNSPQLQSRSLFPVVLLVLFLLAGAAVAVWVLCHGGSYLFHYYRLRSLGAEIEWVNESHDALSHAYGWNVVLDRDVRLSPELFDSLESFHSISSVWAWDLKEISRTEISRFCNLPGMKSFTAKIERITGKEPLSIRRDNQLMRVTLYGTWCEDAAPAYSGERLNDEDLAEFCQCPSLESLSLSYGRFSGKGFARIQNLSRLEYLSVRQSEIEGDTSLEKEKSSLRHVFIGNSTFGPGALNCLHAMRSLRILRILGVALEESHLKAIASIERLDSLGLTDCGLESLDWLPFEKWPDLHALALEKNKLRSLPAGLSTLKRLEKLHLEHNELRSLPADLSRLRRLKFLPLTDNRLTAEGLQGLAGVPNLEQLDLSENQITDEILAAITFPPGLKSLYLDRNQIRGHGSLVNLKSLEKLKNLSLSDNRIDDAGLACFPKIENLEYLSLDNNPIEGRAMDAINALPRIRNLSLKGTNDASVQ